MPTLDKAKLSATAKRYRATEKFKRTLAAWKEKNRAAVSGYSRASKQKVRAFIHTLKSAAIRAGKARSSCC